MNQLFECHVYFQVLPGEIIPAGISRRRYPGAEFVRGPFGGPVLCCVEADDGVKPVFRFVFAFLHGVGERIEQRFRFFLMEDVCYTLSIKLLKSK